ncbi:calcium-transporting ATPase 1 [Carica papaya]|uniref:calcium-transporting ATPase 1 n=1 Tax=Carica papaya TaxID=3649 RepID=UPI000B8C80D5|nr:calcium-transporting ATPase 1 [Carica papaya]
MESYLDENWDVKPKNSSEEALQRWRKLCWIVKNRKRRFRFTANLSKRFEAEAIRRSNQEKFRVAVLVSQAALQFIHGLNLTSEYSVPEEVRAAGFQICPDELGSIVEGHDVKKLKLHGGVLGIAEKLSTSITSGIDTSEHWMNKRKEIYGANKFAESPVRGFWVFVWEALQDTTLMILAVCAFVSLVVGVIMEGWPKGAHDGLGIVASILLVVFVTATSDYKQSLQFKDLDKEKKKITVQVTRNKVRQKLSIYDLLPGDIVHLAIGDQVPADGLFVSGFSVLINESSLTGESEPVDVNATNPFLLSGTKVQDGSCKMLVTTVGMRTQWGKLMATLSEGVMARSSPLDKHTLVRHLRTTFEEVVAVTGDGTNDAPALHEADIGLAMGIAGTEVAKESADVIILDDNFSTIVTVAKWGRSVYVNIQKFVQFQLTVNIVALIVNFSSACLTGNAPLTAVQLLWVNMIMDTLGALALATEPPSDDLMKRSPVGRKGNFISNVMWRNILGQSLYQFVIIWYLQTRGKAVFRLDGPDSDLILNTLIFNSFVFCQVFNEISSREMEKINVFKGILKNYVFLAVLTCTVFFQIVIVEFLGTFANTSPLTLHQWLVSVFLGFLGMPIAAALKLIPLGSN